MRKAIRLTSLGFVMGLLVGAGSFATAQSVAKVSAASKVAAAPVNEAVAVRIVGERNGHVVGTLVARVDDKWVEIELATAAETERMDLKPAP